MQEIGPRKLAFFAGKFDVDSRWGDDPDTEGLEEQAPQAVCETNVGNVPRTMLVNPARPPFDNPELRRAMSLRSTAKPSTTSSTVACSRSAR